MPFAPYTLHFAVNWFCVIVFVTMGGQLRPWFHVKIKLFYIILDPSVDRPKIILFQHETTSKIILKNFSINIHEAVLQPIDAFVYCKGPFTLRTSTDVDVRQRPLTSVDARQTSVDVLIKRM